MSSDGSAVQGVKRKSDCLVSVTTIESLLKFKNLPSKFFRLKLNPNQASSGVH